jgi:hypothetical protein
MVIDFTADVTQVEILAGDFDRAPKVLERELPKTLDKSADIIKRAAIRNLERSGAVASRKLVKSIAVGVTSRTGRTVKAHARHAAVVERGRRAGVAMPPAGALIAWMRLKGIDTSYEFKLREGIRDRGIKARPFMSPALLSSRRAIDREFLYLAALLTKAMATPSRSGVTAR